MKKKTKERKKKKRIRLRKSSIWITWLRVGSKSGVKSKNIKTVIAKSHDHQSWLKNSPQIC